MRKLSWLLLLVIGSGAWAGYIDTDGYYLMDALELSAWDGATAGTAATMTMSGPNGTISGISAGGNWWLQFQGNMALLPADLTGVKGWKLTFENTSASGYLNLVLVAQTGANSWIQGDGYGCNPGETTTAYLDLEGQGPEQMTGFYIIPSVDGSVDVLSFKAIGAADKGHPWDPMPEDDPQGLTASVLPETVLMWNTAMVKDPDERPNPDIRKHYLFGNFADPSDPNLYYVGEVDAGDPVAATAQYPETGSLNLDPLTVYRWQVKEGLDDGAGGVYPYDDPNGLIEGPVWTFKTASNEPIVTQSPAYTAVFPGDTATLTARFFSLYPISEYHWYWSGDNGATYTELTDGAHPSGSGSTVALAISETAPKTMTLTLTNAQGGDDGWYYCTLTNPEGVGMSPEMPLAVKRMVAYYPFNGSLTDASGEGNDGTAAGGNGTPDLGYDAGVVDQAVVLNAATASDDPNQTYIELPTSGYPNAAPGGAMEAGTVLFWYKSWGQGRIMGSANADPDPTAFIVGLDSNFDIFVNGTANVPNNPSLDVLLADNTWRFGAARWQLGEENRLYAGHLDRNGISSKVTEAEKMTAFNDLEHPMLIGAENWRGTIQSFLNNAMIDELRIYNYPLTDAEIADIYNGVSNQGLCAAQYAGAFDFDGDCIVSLSDFAELAGNWLSCGILPDSACGN